jgi:tetratricopeptide (TPR) repeat protein
MSKPIKPKTSDTPFDPLPWLMGALLFLAVFFAYRPAANGKFIWDDDDYVSHNPAVHDLAGLSDIWFHPTRSPQYYPMVFTTFWAQAQLETTPAKPGVSVEEPTAPFHEVNILLHAFIAILLWRILRRLKIPGAFLAALLFAVHPVMVESVAWITERKNTLSLLFYLSSLYAYLRFAKIDAPEKEDPPHFAWYTTALLFFIFALLSKTVTASLPAAILLILWWKRSRVSIKHLLLLLPFFALGIAASFVTSYMEHSVGNVGATGPEWNYSFPQRLLIAGRAVWFYAAKLLWPANLTFVYPKWNINPAAIWQWIFPIALLIVIATLFALRRRIGRGPLVAVLLFVGTLFPALGFINIYPMRYTFVADHYQYHAAIALIVLIAAAATLLHRKYFARQTPWAGPTAAAIVILLLFLLTLRQAGIYQDPKTLWTDTTQKNPNSWMAWLNLGHTLDSNQKLDAYQKAMALAPNIPEPHFNVGTVYFDQHDYPAAEAQLKRAIELEPRYANAFDMLGQCLVRQGRLEEAIKAYHAALAIDPQHNLAHLNLGIALRDQGHLEQAAAEFTQAAQVSPLDPRTWRELANCRIKQKQFEQAIPPLEQFLKLLPNNADAHWDLAMALTAAHHPEEEAREHLSKAISLNPQLANRLRKTP